jgi:hypothetical protein
VWRTFTFGLLGAVLSLAQHKLPFACTAADIERWGLACSADEPCAVFLELSSIESTGSRLFLTGNFHTESLTLYSVLLVSEDAGKTWKEAHDRIRSATLDTIQFVDFQHGFIAGGLVLSLPRDPFFLVTTDGGLTWRDRPVFDETRVGTINEFWFENKNVGQMVIDRTQRSESGHRYEWYETQTAADTWLPKQFSDRPLQLKRTKAEGEAGWRIRPDAKAKTILIERRDGDRWVMASSFSLRVPDCKPADPVQSPPQ